MSKGSVFVVDDAGNLVRMRPAAPQSEDHMQLLVAKFPELIGDGDGDLLLIRREKPVADSVDGSGRWSLDHLFVTRGAIPVLVELKRASDTRLRREIVGQMMDYAANAVAYWQAGHILQAFINTCSATNANPDAVLSAFIPDRDPVSFWSDVDANIEAGRLKLIFVADVIPPELARIVEFLNLQMKAEVRAIELNWFTGDGGITTLVPRVIGATQVAVDRKRARQALETMSREEWIGLNIKPKGEHAMRGAIIYIETMEMIGCRTEVAATHGSIFAEYDGDDGKPFSPFHLWQSGFMSLSYKWLWQRRGLADEAIRKDFIDRFSKVLGSPTTRNVRGYPSFKIERLAIPENKLAFVAVAQDFIDAARVA